MEEITWTKEKLKDDGGRSLTQSLFLELGYNTQYAIFTLNDEDKVYKDKVYPSLKKWYLEVNDPTEYEFARKCLLGWRHWKRLLENKDIRPYIDEWREELEISLRSESIRSIMEQSTDNFQASKWLADKGWAKNNVGRPSKAEKEREKNIQEKLSKTLEDNVVRMEKYSNG